MSMSYFFPFFFDEPPDLKKKHYGGNYNFHLENYRAIRTRTVDLLGKIAQTFFIIKLIRTVSKTQHAFFLHWALSLTDIH